MAAISNQGLRRSSQIDPSIAKWGWAAVELGLAYAAILNSAWWWLLGLAFLAAAVELRGHWSSGLGELKERLLQLAPELIVVWSTILTMAVLPRRLSQLVLLAGFAVWLAWRARSDEAATSTFVHLLLVQAIMFEGIFLSAAIWQTPAWLILALVWAGAYLSVYSVLHRQNERTAGVVAATWAVIATEVSWVLMLWLVTYVLQQDGFVMVPQPALILTALAYVFGSIFLASRQGILSRSRLAEYLIIGLILVLIVVVETLWRHAA